MATRVTPQEIVEMHRLYAQLGSYAAVGRKMGRSGSTVARYIKLKGTPKIVAHTFKKAVKIEEEQTMKNKVAFIFKIIAIVIFVCGGIASLIFFSKENMALIGLYILLGAFFAGMFDYAIGEGLQLLSDIKQNTSAQRIAQNNPQTSNNDLPEL